jgi:hypothetical protein
LKVSWRDPSLSLGMTDRKTKKPESRRRFGFSKYYPADAV